MAEIMWVVSAIALCFCLFMNALPKEKDMAEYYDRNGTLIEAGMYVKDITEPGEEPQEVFVDDGELAIMAADCTTIHLEEIETYKILEVVY